MSHCDGSSMNRLHTLLLSMSGAIRTVALLRHSDAAYMCLALKRMLHVASVAAVL